MILFEYVYLDSYYTAIIWRTLPLQTMRLHVGTESAILTRPSIHIVSPINKFEHINLLRGLAIQIIIDEVASMYCSLCVQEWYVCSYM